MFSRRFARSAGLAVLLANVLAAPLRAADGPTLLKRTLAIRLHRYLRYWPSSKSPTARRG